MNEYIQEMTIRGMRHTHTQNLKRTHLEYVCSAKIVLHVTIYPFLIILDPVVCF
jgi:hypothetical protein